MAYKMTTFEDLKVGQEATFAKTITEADLSHFIAITGDVNPLHVDEEFARQTFFETRIAHGMVSASLFSTLVGMRIPGVGAIYRSQTLEFLRPVRVGDTLTATLKIEAIDPEANRIEMSGWIENQKGEVVTRGASVASLMRQQQQEKKGGSFVESIPFRTRLRFCEDRL